MPWPTPLLRNNPNVHKNDFGHVLVLAGSKRMVGAAALCGLAALRAGAGLVTVGIPRSLNQTIQKKIANEIMTWPLPETKEQSLSLTALSVLQRAWEKFDAIAIGPGVSVHPSTQKLILNIIANSPRPLVIDADALNALPGHLTVLKKNPTAKILTPHAGEMARLTHQSQALIGKNRQKVAKDFARQYRCILVLKGHRTIVASPTGTTYTNRTGNAGMATAGSGDVLTGMIAAFLAQGLPAFDAARWGCYLHGRAGDFAAKTKTPTAMIASDIIDNIPKALRRA
jgi:NAD(P)H-hydrate epimerase